MKKYIELSNMLAFAGGVVLAVSKEYFDDEKCV